jgi:hypothetical protein
VPEAGLDNRPEEAPFHTPVFVVTHTKRDPWERPGGTTFHFVNDGIEHALDQAREAAGDRDVRIAGGGARVALEPVRSEPSSRVTHLTYATPAPGAPTVPSARSPPR